MSFLKGRFSSSSAKPCPKTKAVPKKRPASASAQTSSARNKIQKSEDDSKAVPVKRKVNMIQTSDDGEVPDQESQLSAADKVVISTFDAKTDDLLALDPPLGDTPFKQYLTDRLSGVSQLVNEIKQKKKSVGRRKTQKDQGEDPLFEALSAIECRLKELVNVIKSSWQIFQVQFCHVFFRRMEIWF